MKKILLSTKDLNIGGIENALINLVKYLLEKNYKVTLVVENKKGKLLKELPADVKIIIYSPSRMRITLLRKIINGLKRFRFILKYKNQFDTSISFATYSKSGAFVARTASKNSILWCHADYLSLFEENKKKVEEFFEELDYESFSKLVFVSKRAQESFLEVFPNQKNTYFCNNLIDHKKIYDLTEEEINIKYEEDTVTFLNVGRHDERQKRLSRIIEAAEMLKEEEYKFRVIFVGGGQDFRKYIKMVKDKKLEENVIFVGTQENPYPYFKISNCIVMSSDYEGYPLVFLESFLLNKPIITTDVSDWENVQNGRGIVIKKSTKDLYNAMKRFIQKGYTIQKEFNVTKYNNDIKNKLDKIL